MLAIMIVIRSKKSKEFMAQFSKFFTKSRLIAEDGVKNCRVTLSLKYYFTSLATIMGVIVAAVLFVFTVLFATPALAQSTGVCGRTPQVRDALLARVQANADTVTACSQVTTAHLQALTGTMDLFNRDITSLKSGDFANLTNLSTIFLGGNRLTGLPDELFDSLANLSTLYLSGNDLQTLPDGIFDDLANLRDLNLSNNALQTLSDGVFDDLAKLTELRLNGNDLQTLSDGVFDELAKLRILRLNDNDLQMLPDGIFEDLANLRNLHLFNNPGFASFLPAANAGMDQEVVSGTTVSLDGSASGDGPWGTNITYAWAVADDNGNQVTDLTLTGGDTSTPSFIMPETAPGDGLVLTLTVQGKGYHVGNLYKSTDSVRAAIRASPTVTSVALSSVPADGTTYGNGESIEVVVIFEQPATVDFSVGRPSIGLTVGTDAKTAGYTRGSGGRYLVFAYEVQASDTDTDGVSVQANSLMPNGGRIVNPDGDLFQLTHNGLSDDISHKVSGAGMPPTAGICGRTSQVRVELLRLIQVNDSNVADCSQVTTAHLQAMNDPMELDNKGISSLKLGDFANLTNLEELNLYNNGLQTLPAGVFEGLTSLRNLTLYDNDFRALPEGIFEGLANLSTVFLNRNRLTGLPEGIFEGLAKLRNLYLYGNDLQTLPGGVFENLTNLKELNLRDNDLQTLPDGIFEDLSTLRTLYLTNNPGSASFRPTADAGVDQQVVVGRTVSLDGSASRGGPWGTNITYAWAVADGEGNPVTDLTLTGGGTSTPSFMTPESASGGELVFTLTVTGKPGFVLYKSTASVRVAVRVLQEVTSIVLASAPANGTTYGNGESIEVVVTFEHPATVDILGGTPVIGLTVGAAAKTVGYTRGSGSRYLVFTYQVQASDTDTDGVSVPVNSLRRNGGRIGYPPYGFGFRLTHNGLSDDISHKVSGASAGTPLTGGICGRTSQVRALLLRLVEANDNNVANCSQVTTAHLQALNVALNLARKGITDLKSGDFANLTNLVELHLHDNGLRTLPDGIFEDLTNLLTLSLHDNDLQTLSEDIFDGLANLSSLRLNDNDLQTLPDGIFEDLASLNNLYLDNNPGTASFQPTADAGADQETVTGMTVRLDGSASRGGPWGTNITYVWAVVDARGNPVTDLTLTGGDTSTPSFISPEPPPGGWLVFTLTMQGKGHRRLNLYKSTASVRVVIPAAPAVTSVVLASAPTNGTAYGNGESIEVVVTFEESATVDISGGTPRIGLTVGTAAKTAGYTRGSGGRNLVFTYEVQASDTDTDGVSAPANSLMLNGGRIVNPDGAVFRLTHDALTDDISHKVSGAGTPLTGGICGRTSLVRAELLRLVQANDNNIANCSQVTTAHLQGLTGALTLTRKGIVELKSGDFANLINLASLFLYDNELQTLPDGIFDGLAKLRNLYFYRNHLRALPAGIFDDLANLQKLRFQDNDLRTLPAGIFDDLANLQEVYLNDNDLQMLPAGIFDGLANLSTLNLYDNDLQTLPAGIFDNLANLKNLNLSNNALRTLPAGIFDSLVNLWTLYLRNNDLQTLPVRIFEDLASLRSLYLENNAGTASFLPTAAAGTDQKAVAGAMVRLDGSASRGGHWGTNITYSWSVADAQNSPVAGITLIGGDTATPSFVMPDTAPASGYVFTLTVQGKGHRGLDLYKSTDSVRVAMDVLPLVWVNVVDATVTEGTTAQFNFSRSRDSMSVLEVQVSISGHRKVMTSGTGSAVVTFEAGTTETTMDFATQADSVNEGDGEVTIAIVGSPGVYEIGRTGSATVLVRDDDIPEVTLRWISPAMTLRNNVWVGSMVEGQEIEFDLECTGGFRAASQTPVSWPRFPLRFQELLNHPLGIGGYNVDTKRRFPCAGDQGACLLYHIQMDPRRFVGPNNGRIEVDLFPQVLDLNELPGGSNNSSIGIICYLDSRPRSPEDIRFCPKYTLGAVTSARIGVTNRNPTIIVEAIDDAVPKGEPARFRVNRVWESDVLAAYSTAFIFKITAIGPLAESVPNTTRTFSIGESELIIEIPTIDDGMLGADGLVTFELVEDTSDSQSTNIGGRYEIYDQLPGITPRGENSRIASVRILSNVAPTSADRTVAMDEDTSYRFGSVDFAFTDTNSGDALMSVKVVTLPGAGSLTLNGIAVTANDVVAVADISMLVFTPVANANGAGYASFTFKVSDGMAESAAVNTMTMDVTAVNDPATGLPTITGTTREGQTLTADVSGIADDVDGLPLVSTFAYQWLRVSGGSDTEIQGAESKTYRVVAADVGSKFKVRVSFTDLDGHAESLTSVVYPADSQVSRNVLPTSADRTVTIDEDTSYTFGSVDFAFTDTDNVDVLVSVKVVTLPGAGSLALDGVAVTANDVVAVADIPMLQFTPVANAHGASYASFTFKVSDGTSESAVANTLTVDVTAVNDPASGLAITGTARVGQTLTADTTNIVDADGLTSPNYRYQWIRVDGGTETDLGTASTHVVTSADEGKMLKVEVTLTDDDSNTETLEAETGTVSANSAPTSADRTVTMDEDTSYTFGSADFAFTDTDNGDVLVSVKVVTLPGAGSLALNGVAVTANDVVAVADIPMLVFTPVANAHGASYASFTFKVSDGVSESAAVNTLTVDVTAVNDPASGLEITGTAREGQTLTADTTNIVDADGLTSPNYRYQWVRVDGGTETNLGTASTHVVTSADEGKKLKVKVTLTDDDSNTETLEAETGTVSANALPTSADRTVTIDEDTSYTFGSVDFAFTDTDNGDALVSVKVVTLPGAGSLTLDGVAVTAGDVVAVADIPMLQFTPVADAHGADYASFTFKVSDGVSESAAVNTMTVDVTAVNDPASGLAITGTAREGQTLTADTTNIVDADGLTSPNYRYQWIQVDGGTETDLGTASTHTVTSADGGKKLKVEVTLTDDDNNTETLEAETGTVSANVLPTSANRTVTIDEDTAHTFGSVDFAFTDTDNGDVLVSVKVVTLPGAGNLALNGVAVTANDVVAVADLPRLVFTPAANAHGAGYASFTFKVSDGVSESAAVNTMTVDVTAVNDPASGLMITGMAREGQTLTADTTNIVDADGLTSPNYRYQWIRVDGGTETNLGTASTHVVTSADEGKKLKVKVTLTDDDSNTEILEAETVLVSGNELPTSANLAVTIDEDTAYTFGAGDFAFTDTDDGDVLVSVKLVTLPGAGSLTLGGVAVRANQVIGTSDLSRLVFTPVANANGAGYASFTFKVNDGVADSVSYTVTVDVTAVNDPASGLEITGTARVGQTLTADTTNIVDTDGLTSPNYRYQWVRVDGGTETNLGTASTHVVTSADEGKKLKVKVTLTDDDSNTETLEAETVLVSGNRLPTSANRTVTIDEDTSYTFGSVDFAFDDTDGGDVLVRVKLVTVPGAGSLTLGGVAVRANQVIGTSDLSRLVFTPAANAHGAGYASFTFKVSDGVSESAAANTLTVDVTAVDDPASGLSITGAARVGQTLTADTTNIVDADGLTSPNYRYQWVRVDGGTETDLGTASTHTVISADEGKKLKVKVTLTDDDRNTETLEGETGTVPVSGNTESCTGPTLTGRTQIWSGTISVGEFLTPNSSRFYGWLSHSGSTYGAFSGNREFTIGNSNHEFSEIYLIDAPLSPLDERLLY